MRKLPVNEAVSFKTRGFTSKSTFCPEPFGALVSFFHRLKTFTKYLRELLK